MRVSSSKLNGSAKPRFSRVRRPTQVLLLAFIISITFTVPVLRLFGLTCRPKDNSQAARIVSSALTQDESILDGLSSTSTNEQSSSTSSSSSTATIDTISSRSAASTAQQADPADGSSGMTTGFRADWGNDVSRTHPFCTTMMNNPIVAQAPLCKRNEDQTCENGPQKGTIPFFSQVGQDYYIYTRHFKHLARKGSYMEAGTRHPITGSNTYFMDSCLRWRGLCIEGNPTTLAYIHRTRACEVVPTCVTQFDGSRRVFVMEGKTGRIEGMKGSINGSAGEDEGFKIKMPCLSLVALFERRNINVLDYLSLDVDGHELEVLKGLDHKKYRVNVLTVSTMDETLNHIQRYLEAVGYVRHIPDLDEHSQKTGLLRNDAIFVHRTVNWGKPV